MGAKTDKNQTRIVKELRAAGFAVKSIASVKKACDLIICKDKDVILVEVKNPEYIKHDTQEKRYKHLTPGEKDFYKDFPVFIATGANEILEYYEKNRNYKTNRTTRKRVEQTQSGS